MRKICKSLILVLVLCFAITLMSKKNTVKASSLPSGGDKLFIVTKNATSGYDLTIDGEGVLVGVTIQEIVNHGTSSNVYLQFGDESTLTVDEDILIDDTTRTYYLSGALVFTLKETAYGQLVVKTNVILDGIEMSNPNSTKELINVDGGKLTIQESDSTDKTIINGYARQGN